MNAYPTTGRISVVIPVYNSAESLPILTERLHRVLSALGRDFEIVFVDDRSRDNSWRVLEQLKAQYGKSLRIARLLVNSGQHNAVLCGLYLSTGAVVITMDDDLQNPPEEIPRLVAAIDQGYDLAIGAYDSKKHTRVRNLGGDMIDWLLRRIFNLPPDFQLTSFRAAKRVVVDNVCQMGGVFPYITAMMFSNASNYVNVPVRHDPRLYGRSNYNLNRSLRLAANLIFSYSSYPLQFVMVLCLLAFFVSVTFGTITIVRAFLADITVPGWASTVVIVSFFNALTLLGLVIFGVYISRISQQITRTRLPYTISELHE